MFSRERNIYGNKSFDLIWVELFYLDHILLDRGQGEGVKGGEGMNGVCIVLSNLPLNYIRMQYFNYN